MKNYHLTYNKETTQWGLLEENNRTPIKEFLTKKEGTKSSTKYVEEKHGSLKIHYQNGDFQEERTYPRGADPKKSKG